MPFEVIVPVAHNMTVTGTTIGAELRTTSASGIEDTHIPYIDQGFESVTIGETNYMSSPRAIYSKVNEDEKLDNNVGNKSLQMRVTLGTVDTRLSPVIDSQRVSVITTSNRVNNAISNYATDDRVKSVFDDPTACQYISKEIRLENPATSIKILLAGHIHVDANVRAFYAISDKQNFTPIFVPFPGYKNIDAQGQIIDPAKNDGLSDTFVPPTNEESFDPNDLIFNPYEFTVDNLPSFKSYRIKIVATSTSLVYVPQIKGLRVLAMA